MTNLTGLSFSQNLLPGGNTGSGVRSMSLGFMSFGSQTQKYMIKINKSAKTK